VRNAPEEDDDDADTVQRGDEVDPFGLNVSSIVQQGGPWKTRHDRLEDLIVMLMQHSGMSAIGEPRSVVNGLIPRPLLREYTQEGRAHRVLQGAERTHIAKVGFGRKPALYPARALLKPALRHGPKIV
jgi:hypothetical protein